MIPLRLFLPAILAFIALTAITATTGCLPAKEYHYNKKSSRDTLTIHPRDSSYLLMKKFADLPSTDIRTLAIKAAVPAACGV